MGKPAFPIPCLWGAIRSQRRLGHGETGFPQLPPCGEGLGGLRPPKRGNTGFPIPLPLKGGQNIWAPTGVMALGCAG